MAEPTVVRYENLARRFLGERMDAVGDRFVEELSGADVTGFLVRETRRLAVGSAKGLVAELRSLLKLKGFTTGLLSAAVPPVAGWHDTTVPIGLLPAEVNRLLDSCNRESPDGIRDYAILMLVARLGLRSIEVARLELDEAMGGLGKSLCEAKDADHCLYGWCETPVVIQDPPQGENQEPPH